MITPEKIRPAITAVLLITAAASVLSFFSFSFQFYVWEFYLDGRLLVLSGIAYAAWKKGWLSVTAELLTLQRFAIVRNILLFLLPLLMYAIPVAAGYFLKELKIEAMDNAVTIVLATLFDLPAIYVFSATTILLEELLFRNILLRSFRSQFGEGRGVLIAVVIWTIYCIPEVLAVKELPVKGAMILVLYFSVTGFFCSALFLSFSSVWAGYSFRTGITALTPILITSVLTESDSFVTTSSVLYGAEGIIVSLLMLVTGIVIYRRTPQSAIPA